MRHLAHGQAQTVSGLHSVLAGEVVQEFQLPRREQQFHIQLRHLACQQRKHDQSPSDHTLDRDVPPQPRRGAKSHPQCPAAHIQHLKVVVDSAVLQMLPLSDELLAACPQATASDGSAARRITVSA